MNNLSSAPGFPCPECGALVTATIEQLVAPNGIHCSKCGLELRIDQEQSWETLKAVRTFQRQLAQVKRNEC